jgi:predicted RNA-binding Zn-ribbon protein involved in translation (DUF1610 family)
MSGFIDGTSDGVSAAARSYCKSGELQNDPRPIETAWIFISAWRAIRSEGDLETCHAPAFNGGRHMNERRRVELKAISPPMFGPVVRAPPVLEAGSHTVDYACENCGAVLLQAEDEQVHNLQIHCEQCGAFNITGN